MHIKLPPMPLSLSWILPCITDLIYPHTHCISSDFWGGGYISKYTVLKDYTVETRGSRNPAKLAIDIFYWFSSEHLEWLLSSGHATQSKLSFMLTFFLVSIKSSWSEVTGQQQGIMLIIYCRDFWSKLIMGNPQFFSFVVFL